MVMTAEMMGRYGLLAPATMTISVASVVVSDGTIYTSQPATPADSLAHRLSLSFPLLRALRVCDAMAPPAMDAACDVQAQSAETGDRRAARCREHTWRL